MPKARLSLKILNEKIKKLEQLFKVDILPPIVNVSMYVTDETYKPYRKHETDACWDIKSAEGYWIRKGKQTLVKTGIFMAIPEGYHAEITPRSGLSIKHGLTIINSPGIIDSDYRDEVGVIMTLIGGWKKFYIDAGDRIAQMRIVKNINTVFEYEHELRDLPKPKTDRSGGFGSTGK